MQLGFTAYLKFNFGIGAVARMMLGYNRIVN